MDLIYFLSSQIKKWDDEKRCGQCFKFYAPLTESALNKQQIEDCCINVMLTRDGLQPFGKTSTYNNLTGTLSDLWEFKNFKLYFVVPQELGLNNYNEILGHSTEESKSTKLEELEKCILDMEFDFCEFAGSQWQVTTWYADNQLLDFRDNNYTGYRLNISIRRRVIR